MRKNSSCLSIFMFFFAAIAAAQVMKPAEIKDPELRGLQQQYMDDLTVFNQIQAN